MSTDDVRHWMEAKGYSIEHLAAFLDVSAFTIRRFLGGKSMNPNNYRRLIQLIRADSAPKKAAIG